MYTDLGEEWPRLPLSAFELWERNYRRGNVSAIRKSIEQFGFNGALRVRFDGEKCTVYGGNHACLALIDIKESGGAIPSNIIAEPSGDWLVPYVNVSHLSVKECEAFAIADNTTPRLGEDDQGMLNTLLAEIAIDDPSLLLAASVEDSIIASLVDGINSGSVADLLDPQSSSSHDPNYERSVEAPIYEPKGDCPDIGELVDETRFSQLLTEIEAAPIDDGAKRFLRLAAARHLVFDYEKIAEHYCHASPPVQRLMENSALVIIDFKKALELGFVKLIGELRDIKAAEEAREVNECEG